MEENETTNADVKGAKMSVGNEGKSGGGKESLKSKSADVSKPKEEPQEKESAKIYYPADLNELLIEECHRSSIISSIGVF